MPTAQSTWCLERSQLGAYSPVSLVLTVQSAWCLEPSQLGAYSQVNLALRTKSTTYGYIRAKSEVVMGEGLGIGKGGEGVGGGGTVFQYLLHKSHSQDNTEMERNQVPCSFTDTMTQRSPGPKLSSAGQHASAFTGPASKNQHPYLL